MRRFVGHRAPIQSRCGMRHSIAELQNYRMAIADCRNDAGRGRVVEIGEHQEDTSAGNRRFAPAQRLAAGGRCGLQADELKARTDDSRCVCLNAEKALRPKAGARLRRRRA
jgi:hypothetical protein